MIRYVIGRAGSGKTEYIFRQMKEHHALPGDQSIILLVPEDNTMQAERNLIERAGLPGIMHMEVLSFKRLAERVFAEAGGSSRVFLDETGKSMALKKTIDALAGELLLYSRVSNKNGFINQISSAIRMLKQHDIYPERLESVISRMEHRLLKEKLHDLDRIFRHFHRFLEQHYLDTEEYYNLFIEKLPHAFFMRDAHVWVDGFYYFTPQQYRMLEQILLAAKRVTITFTLDPADPEEYGDIFTISRETRYRVQQIAGRWGLKEETVHLYPGSSRTASLRFLEKEFFARSFPTFPGQVDDIHLSEAADPYREVEQTALEILALVRDRQMRFNQIALMGSKLDLYRGMIKRVFDEYQIPFFWDRKKKIVFHPVVQFLLGAMDIICHHFTTHDVLTFAKTGLSPITPAQCEHLENYVLQYGIQGDRWKRDFTAGESGHCRQINVIRSSLLQPLLLMEEETGRASTYGDFNRALYRFYRLIQLPEHIQNWNNKLQCEGNFEQVQENIQVWHMVLDLLDQNQHILGDETCTLEEYKKVLESGLQSIEIGTIPSTLDQVLVGDLLRPNDQEIEALFVIGVNEGVFPEPGQDQTLFSRTEMNILRERGLDMGSSAGRELDESHFLLYKWLARPGRFLYFSYCRSDSEGRPMQPALFVHRLKLLLGRIGENEEAGYRADPLKLVGTAESTFKYLGSQLAAALPGEEPHALWREVYQWYRSREEWSERLEMMLEAVEHFQPGSLLSVEKAAKLYGAPFVSGISALEKYIQCPFAHFMQYGLKVGEREMYSMGPLQRGEIYHHCIRLYAEHLSEHQLEWWGVPPEELKTILVDILDRVDAAFYHNILDSSPKLRHMKQKIGEIMQLNIEVIGEQMQRSRFKTWGQETPFGRRGLLTPLQLELEDGGIMFVEGRIDRIDILDEPGCGYVNIVDYKSGFASSGIHIADIYQGTSLQLPVYMLAVLAAHEHIWGKPLHPAGLLLYPLHYPRIKTQGEQAADHSHTILAAFKMRGIVLEDAEIVQAMDRDIGSSSAIIPAGLNKDGSLSKKSSTLKLDDFYILLSWVRHILQRSGAQILRGNIKAEPARYRQRTACDFCNYGFICRFDGSSPGHRYKSMVLTGAKQAGDILAEMQRVVRGNTLTPEILENDYWPVMNGGNDDHF